ncbi:twin-arginine translocation signal domain-containing protein [Streptomyces erythrochromogenes]|uniref:Twin-arginine translocation signal domain-containing protein n=1 Tax=Streptomyces erythrochromogenes TaxID=285574 RepID=A0ABZ1QN47_9ACTN|nr:twin-arginine translocation signal domain-containing protein [Streptomyces erythrochromogenes]
MSTDGSAKRATSRRGFLKTGAGVAAAVVGGAALPLFTASPASAVVPDSPRFKLDGSGGNPIWKKPLHANWVMQSFGYDNVHRHVYFLQTKTGSTNGDLWVTQTDTGGNQLGSMALHGFGHGVSIAVEPYGGQVHLWTEWKTSASGFGTRIGRFPFVNGAVLEQDDPSVQDRTPSIGDTMINPQPVIDPSTDRLLVRYNVGTDQRRIVAFTLNDARAGRLTSAHRLVERALPARGDWGKANPFQGFAAYGRYAYLLEGPVGNPSYITTVDLNDVGNSTVVDRFATTAGQSLPGREPQGMAIWQSPGGPRLAFGFHSNTSGARHASVFYKSEFV